MFSPPVEEVLHFLTELFEASCGYSALNTARSALSTFIVLPGNMSLVTRFMKGVFQSRPTFPKYTEIWDLNVVLCYLILSYLILNSVSCCKIVSQGLDLQGRCCYQVKGSKQSNCWI